jgi:hypothetical protein
MADTPAHREGQQPNLKPWVLLNPKATVGGDRVRLFCIPQVKTSDSQINCSIGNIKLEQEIAAGVAEFEWDRVPVRSLICILYS